MRYLCLFAIILVFMGCTQPQASPDPKVLLTDVPESPLVEGSSYAFSWTVNNADEIEHTNIHASWSPDFSDHTDSDVLSTPGPGYTTEFALPDGSGTLYLRAHARVGGRDVHSQLITREVVEEESPEKESEITPTEQEESQVAQPEHKTVLIQGFSYHPRTFTVAAGTKVTWKNKDSAPHTVSGPGFDSGSIPSGASFSHTFGEGGTFAYGCDFHSSMHGSLTVE